MDNVRKINNCTNVLDFSLFTPKPNNSFNYGQSVYLCIVLGVCSTTKLENSWIKLKVLSSFLTNVQVHTKPH
jgi:hypothetical protein